MVKVECDGCQSPYQIDERRIPPSGLKMRCPKCGTSLLVMRPGQAPPPAGAPAPAPAPPPAPRPPPPRNPTGEFGGIDLPAPAAPRAPAAPAPRAAPAPQGGGGGFGEIDLMVDLDGQGGGGGGGGEIDLPQARPAAPAFGGVDLPAARPGVPEGFGTVPSGGAQLDFGGVDLPAARGPAPLPPPQMPPPQMPPPQMAHGRDVGLPVPSGGGAGLPSPYGGGLPMSHDADLPAVSAGANLPAFGGGGSLPAFGGGGGAGLPMVGGAALPMAGGAGLPMAGGAGLPMAGGAGLPMAGGAGLPMAGGAGLPTVGGPGLPMAGGAGLPTVGMGGLPTTAGPGLPMPGGHLPAMSMSGLPAVGGGLPAMGGGLPPIGGGGGGALGGLPSALDAFGPAGGGLPMNTGSGLEASIGGEASLGGFGGGAPPPPPSFGREAGGVDIGSVDLGGSLGGVGGEVELEGSLPGGGGGTLLELPKQRTSLSITPEADVAPSNRGKYVAFALVGAVLVGGALMSATSLGPFGMYAISDALSGSNYEEKLSGLRKTAQEEFDVDTSAAAMRAADTARALATDQKRHGKTNAYAAYVIYAKSLRFGRDGGLETVGKTMLESVDKNADTNERLLAVAAEAALAGELARSREALGRVQGSLPDDVDAAVLSGEVELLARAPDAAIAAFTKAVAIHKSPRTLFGLARAQLAAGKTAEAEATAKSVLESSKGHVAARTMLASLAAGAPDREKEALAHLDAITKDAEVRANASDSELVESYIQLGRVHLIGSRISQAQEAYGEALKLNPQAVSALVGSGELFYRAGRFSEAEARFESALRADADNLDAKIGTAKTWLKLERHKEAKDLLRKLKDAHPADARIPYWLARVEESMGTRKEAEALYKEAIQKAQSSETAVPPYVGLANLLTSVGRTDDAAKQLKEAAEKFPDSSDLARARGDVALQTGKYEQALEQYSSALKKGEDLATLFSLGVTLRRMRQFDQAVQVFDKVAKVDKEYPGLALERGLYYEETGQSDLALQMYAEALQKAPNDVDLKLRIGSTLVAAGQAKQAEPTLKEVIRERPNSAEANHFLGRAMLLSGSNLNESMRHLQRAVDLDGNRAEYFLYVGWASNEAGQPGRAETALAKALELDSSLGDAFWQRGVLLQKQGATVDAIKDLEKALELRPSRYEAYATLALCFEDQSAWARAEEAWQKAIAGNEKQPDWHFRLARVFQRKRDQKGIVTEMEKAIELSENREPRPGWLADAHFALGDAYRATEKEKAIQHYTEFLRLSPPDNAYRSDAERELKVLKPE